MAAASLARVSSFRARSSGVRSSDSWPGFSFCCPGGVSPLKLVGLPSGPLGSFAQKALEPRGRSTEAIRPIEGTEPSAARKFHLNPTQEEAIPESVFSNAPDWLNRSRVNPPVS